VAPPGILRRNFRQALSKNKPPASRKATSPATGTEHQHGMGALNWEVLEHPAIPAVPGRRDRATVRAYGMRFCCHLDRPPPFGSHAGLDLEPILRQPESALGHHR
jgi:hypothetical protein